MTDQKEQKSSVKFVNTKTGEGIRFDYGDPDSIWAEKDDHYHK